MKTYFAGLFLISSFLFGCSKSSGSNSSSTPQEQPIAFTIDATNNTVSTGNTYGVNVTLTSTMPPAGIKIDITTTDQVSNTVVQNQSLTSNSTKTAVTVSNMVQQHWNTVNIKVTSASTSSNSSSQSFTVIYK